MQHVRLYQTRNLVQPAVDYGASIMCGMGGYAAIPENLLGQCGRHCAAYALQPAAAASERLAASPRESMPRKAAGWGMRQCAAAVMAVPLATTARLS